MIFPINSAKSQQNHYETTIMSSTEDYRQELLQQITAERERSNASQIGASRSLQTDEDRLRDIVIGPNSDPDPAVRADALGQLVSKSDRSSAQALPLDRLSDSQEAVQVRLAALEILQLLSISSPTFTEWRPAYLEALRSTLEVSELQLPAFDALIAQGDRSAQERLVQGLEDPAQALVPPADALNLLSEDAHADVRALARQFVDQPPDEETLQAAIRHLAGDPSSVERLRAIINDSQQSTETRKLAVTALNALDPDALPAPESGNISPVSRGIPDASETDASEDSVDELLQILSNRRQGQ